MRLSVEAMVIEATMSSDCGTTLKPLIYVDSGES
jgi:hypothetical protein